MKFILIFLTFFVGFLTVVNSQDFNGGILVGISATQVDGDSYGGFNKAGLILGAFVHRDFKEKIAGQIELKYIGKGSTNGNPRNYGYTFLYDLRLHYIEVPVLFQYEVIGNLSLEIGPAFGFLVKSVEKNEQGIMPDSKPFNKFELSGSVGVGYSFFERFKINARFSYSLLPIREHAGGGTYYSNKGQSNKVLEFILLVRLGKISKI